MRDSGSCCGQNGIKSVILHIGNQDFCRIRIGIGRPTVGTIVDYVLSPFDLKEKADVGQVIDRCVQAIEDLEKKTFSDVMNIYNQKRA